ncbi:MAG TPA: type III pantothenate kinase [Chakrabartia sp.]|jgi:type III pantothenate kinase|nr:type III pantothenate kinase [Chakrabartia sp.]
MLLAIDVGNTNVKFALVQDGDIRTRWRIHTDARRTADQYAVWLFQLIELAGFARTDVDAVIISTVVPRALHNLEMLATKYFKVDPVIAGKGRATWPMQLDVANPASLGADRAVNSIAAHALHSGDKVMISFGTATTVDHVDFTGAYKGGLIAPGLNLSLEALVSAAAKLPRIAIEALSDPSVIGRDTESQMQIGIYWGYVSMMEGLIARMKAEIARPAKVIATGGLAAVFQQNAHLFDAIEPDLTLKGLALLHRHSQVQ